MKILLSIFILIFLSIPILASPFKYEKCNLGWEHVHHEHNESSYQQVWCKAHGGIEEYENKDFTRVDCLTKTHAVEFDFANKWAESIGQALHYGIMTGRKPMVVLILDNPQSQMLYYRRLKRIAKIYSFDTEYVTNEILKVNNSGKCFSLMCKCQDNE